MRTPWEIQCTGLRGLSLGFPSAAYSLHFISWLTRCVAIHLELLRSFDPPFLQVLLIRDRSSSQLKSPCPAGGCCWGQAGDRQHSFPTPRGEVQLPPPPHRTHHSPSWGRWGSIPPQLCQSRRVRWQCAFCVPPHVSVRLCRVCPLHVSMGHTAAAWVFLDM